MKVAHFLPHFPGREGTTAFCRGLCRALNSMNRGCAEIWSYKESKGDPEDRVRFFPGPRRHPFDLPVAMKAALKRPDERPDGFILHGTFNPPMAAMGRLLRTIGVPYIFMPHDPYVKELMSHGRLKKALYWKAFERPLLEGSTGVILLSEAHERSLRERGYDGRIAVVPNGCDPRTPFFERHTQNEVLRVQYLGRMDRNHKGLDLLIEGFGRFSQMHPDARIELVLSGNDWLDRPVLEEQASRLGLSERIRFTGPRPESSAEVFGQADLAVLTSRFDGFGLTIVEAMLAACPALVTETCGVASYVVQSKGGWSVEATVAGIARGFDDAWREQSRWPSMGRLGRKFVMEHLTWGKAAEDSLAVYQRWFQEKD